MLFNAGTHQLYSLNTTATYIWCCLEEGFAPAQIAHELERTFNFESDAARAHLSAILRQWRELGLLQQPAANDLWDTPNTETIHLQLLDTAFRLLVTPADLVRDLMPLLEPLVTTATADALVLHITPDGEGFSLHGPEGVTERCQRNEIAPLVKIGLVRLALQHSQDSFAIHAAGVAHDGQCLLLPGISGSGKSTLAAALVMAGFGLFGDDTIVLAQDMLVARPMPFAICLKQGAWQLLRTQLPALARLPIHHRPDGKRVRYLLPAAAETRIAPNAQAPVGWIVFPCRSHQPHAELIPLARTEALTRLLRECSPLDGLDAAKVARLVQWISAIPCFELRYGSLDSAVERLRRIDS
ncbi:MAG TPA: PqqD family peptide modification chaperone [Vineibacter sp.]|nr:PqqD family peptide modification chaperone [Vineibacter sp.]